MSREVLAASGVAGWTRYASYLRTRPEMTVGWSDPVTGARAWLVMNSLRGGAAGGGTRMRAGLRQREVTYLAKAMELKFALSGPPIGGAKSGIDFDATDPRKAEVLARFYEGIGPFLRERYGTGGDLNVDETSDVIPAFARLGFGHPQSGVVRGHVRADEAEYAAIVRRLECGVVAPVPPHLGLAGLDLTVSDVVTGYGVARAIERFLEGRGGVGGLRVMVEGFGNVGASCALQLARSGARIVSIRDARRVLREPAGLGVADVEDLFRRRCPRAKLLPADDERVVDDVEAFWTDAEVFVCAAMSETVTTRTLDRLAAHGVRLIACGANQPFREARLGSTRVAQAADHRFSVLADIVSNCGMARAFSYLMEPTAVPTAGAIFASVEDTILESLDEVLDRARLDRTTLLAAALDLALDRIARQEVP